jgi:hypothetical protein
MGMFRLSISGLGGICLGIRFFAVMEVWGEMCRAAVRP